MSLIPEYVSKVAFELEKNGFEAYLVGGSLRNILLGEKPKDYDLTTNALPEKIGEIFPRSVMTNAKFGTVSVLIELESGELDNVEVTTYRSEKDYVGGRWPSHVEFTSSLEEDLKRRDFTVNAMALRLVDNSRVICSYESTEQILSSNNFVDLYQGHEDLKNKLIRAVGDPLERFREDGLRSMRACRLASVYQFKIEENTFSAMKETLDTAAQISPERIRDEFVKLVTKSPKPSIGIELMRECGLLKLYIPELLEGFGMEQNEHHVHDVYRHSLDTVDVAPEEIRIAALFHDIGKPRCKEGAHFYKHDQVGAQMTKEILSRLKFPNKEIDEIVNLVRWHMFYIPKREDLTSEEAQNGSAESGETVDEKEERNSAFRSGWSDSAIRRMIRKVGGQEQIDKLIKLRIADAVANPRTSFDPADIQDLSSRVADIREQDTILGLKDLKITGHDLEELGVKPGPKMKEVLNELLEMVTDDPEQNNKEVLIETARTLIDGFNNRKQD